MLIPDFFPVKKYNLLLVHVYAMVIPDNVSGILALTFFYVILGVVFCQNPVRSI